MTARTPRRGARLAHGLRQPTHQCVGGRIAPRAVRGQYQRPSAAQEPTGNATRSALGSSRPVIEVRRSARPTRR